MEQFKEERIDVNQHIGHPHLTGVPAGQLTFATTHIVQIVPQSILQVGTLRQIKSFAQGHTVYKVVKQNFQF